jgi:hypothetical protein
MSLPGKEGAPQLMIRCSIWVPGAWNKKAVVVVVVVVVGRPPIVQVLRDLLDFNCTGFYG